MSGSEITKQNWFLKIGKGHVVFVQLYILSSKSDKVAYFIDKLQVQSILKSLKEPITSRMKDFMQYKKITKAAKSEFKIMTDNGVKLTYYFRKNSCRDCIIIQNNSKTVFSGNLCDKENFSALPVFQERLIVTVDFNTKSNEVCRGSGSLAHLSEYFSGSVKEATFSGQKKKSSLSKIKLKLAAKGKKIQQDDDLHSASHDAAKASNGAADIAKICKQFEFKQKDLKSMQKNANANCSDVGPTTCGINEMDRRSSVSEAQKNQEFFNQQRMKDSEDNCSSSEHEVLNIGEKNTAFEDEACNNSNAGDADVVEVHDKGLKRKQFAESNIGEDVHNENRNQILKGKRRKLRKRSTSKLALKRRKQTSLDEKPISVDDYNDVCLDNVSCVSQLDTIQICNLVRNMERDIRDIFEGKSFSARHQDYKQGGKKRAELAFKVHFGRFTEDQQDSITHCLQQMFCYKHTKYLDYILKVLVPETMIAIVEKINKDINRSEAEKILADCSIE
eukprot:gene19850-21792_t